MFKVGDIVIGLERNNGSANYYNYTGPGSINKVIGMTKDKLILHCIWPSKPFRNEFDANHTWLVKKEYFKKIGD